MTQLINERDLSFQLYEVLNVLDLCQRPYFSEHDQQTFDGTLAAAKAVAEKYFQPHNAAMDSEEPSLDNEKVVVHPAVKEALDAYGEAGFYTAHLSEEEGGLQIPTAVMFPAYGYFLAGNPALTSFAFLTTAAANVLAAFANDTLKEKYLPPMREGRFLGTMALTEPQAGSSLSDIEAHATPTDEGHYLIQGSKIFISAGEHEVTENIVHLVLARIKGAPAGTKGISLFLVPKFRVEDDGSLGARNDVNLTGLLHKMGVRGIPSTALAFGEENQCHGYLIGEANKGLSYMFQMMNEARLGVGMAATMLANVGYLYSLDYAKTRLQGRSVTNRDVSTPQLPIIQHADVKRMLLKQKAIAEGCTALCLYGAKLIDDAHSLENESERQQAHTLLDLLTPVIKAWPSEYGPIANDLAIQVLAGYGYMREYPVEQFYRDNRLNPIHEGSNGIQALDLLGRKVPMNGGAGMQLLLGEMQKTIAKASASEKTQALADSLGKALEKIIGVAMKLGQAAFEKGPEAMLANASVFLDVMGRVVISWMWLRQAIAAVEGMEHNPKDGAFYKGKCQAAKYFIDWELPMIYPKLEVLSNLDQTCSEMQEDWF